MRQQKTPVRVPRRERFPSSSSFNQTTSLSSPSLFTSPKSTTPNSASSYTGIQCMKQSHWKERLKQKCMERAREKRKQMIQKRRTSSKSFMSDDFLYEMDIDTTNNGNNTSSIETPIFPLQTSNTNSISDSNKMVNGRNYNSMSITARTLIQEELKHNNIQVQSNSIQGICHQQQSSFSNIDMSKPNTSSNSMNHMSIQKNNEDCVLDEDELILLMQEVEEELQREEENMEREIYEFESHQMQQQMMLDEQIADFEMWQQQQANC